MQKALVFSAWVVLALLIQMVILPDFPSIYVWTEMIFYLVVILGLKFSLFTGVIVSALLGFIVDSVSMAPPGTTLFSYLITLLFIRIVKSNIYIETYQR